jgi:uncharacterized protein
MSMPRVNELALGFGCQGEQLVGVLSLPAGQPGDLALLVVVGGPQVRAGSHRQFTQLCREVAAAGVPAMRFDVRGMGDSSGPLHTFEHISPDIGAALDALQAQLPQIRRVVLWGLCDGASAALMYLHQCAMQGRPDARVAGLVLLNPWVRSAQTLARAHVKHYYWNRMREGEFWRKLLRGGVAMRAARDLIGNLRQASTRSSKQTATDPASLPFQERMLSGAEAFGGPALWVLSGNDYTAKEFLELAAAHRRWQTVLSREQTQRLDMPGADHTFSQRRDEQALSQATKAWLLALPQSPS